MSGKPTVATVPPSFTVRLAATGSVNESKLDRLNEINIFSHMDKTAFETRVISVFHNLKYDFYKELQNGETLKRMPASQYAAFLALGALGGLSVFAINQPSFADKEVITELEKLGALCDLIGIKLSAGGVQLVLFVQGDDYADETVIGKCHLIRDQLNSFKKFTMRISWTKMPVFASVFFIFEKSDKAFHFRQSVQEKCKHNALFSKIYVLPWGIDLSAKSVWAHKGLPFPLFKPAELEAKLFS